MLKKCEAIEDYNTKSDLIEALEIKVIILEALTKCTEALASKNNILKSDLGELNGDIKDANKEVKMLKITTRLHNVGTT